MYRTEPAIRAARLLRDGEAVLVLGDDGWGDEPRGHVVRFLDAYARLPAGIVALARLCGSPIVCFYVLPRGPRRWVVTIDPPVLPPDRREGESGERRVLQQLAVRWSEMIAAHPEHWAAVYPIRWQDRP
jgi:lauroyl/myristoyl acyltransferase